jgi:hypothetical protein
LRQKYQELFVRWRDFESSVIMDEAPLCDSSMSASREYNSATNDIQEAMHHDLFSSLKDENKNIIGNHTTEGTIRIEGLEVQEYSEWCNDDYGATEYYESYKKYEFETLYGLCKIPVKSDQA